MLSPRSTRDGVPPSLPLSQRRGPTAAVAGLSEVPVPEEARPVLERLGAALAERGYTLITTGRAGLDEMIARFFYDACLAQAGAGVPAAKPDEPEARLLHITDGDKLPVFEFGGWVQLPAGSDDGTPQQKAIELADVVVLMGGALTDPSALRLAEQLGKRVVPASSF